ncbi:MAG: lysine exporter LysO family protein [Bacillota bacterium]|nr:lysine exporter LysO family protein [Bacillota bacterium]
MDVLILYLGITVIGYFVGAFLKKRGTALRWTGAVQLIAITVLVFVMGCRIGSDESIVKSLDTIGLMAFVLTVFILAGSVFAVFLTRKLLGFDRFGDLHKKKRREEMEAAEQKAEEAAEAEEKTEAEETVELKEEKKNDNLMTVCIIVSVALGILAGYFIMPAWFIHISGTLIVVGLCILLFFVGLDIGTEGTIVENFKLAGWRIIVFPFAVIVGTFAGALGASFVLPIGIQDALCVGSGFGWYTLAPAMLAEYSVKISAISFMHNVMRELLGILLIPFVARFIGYIETVSLPGAAAMDVCLPIVEKSTKSDIAVYSFISGVTLSIAVPVMVSFMMGI